MTKIVEKHAPKQDVIFLFTRRLYKHFEYVFLMHLGGLNTESREHSDRIQCAWMYPSNGMYEMITVRLMI